MKLERLLTLTIVGLLSVGLAFSEFARFQQAKEGRAIVDRLETAETNAVAALNAVIEPGVVSAADNSVYMIVSKDTYFGTAFVVDRERGLLATAAHVIDAMEEIDPEAEYSVLNRRSAKPLAVRATRMHAGYGAFRDFVETYQPIDPESRLRRPKPIALHDFSNDAGMLFVDPIDPETGENILGPNLPVASRETLLALKPGEPVAVIGFPSDAMSPHPEKSAASRSERGIIASMVSPIDLVEIGDDPKANSLIIHRMATAGGNSGGPLINKAGEVIGIHTHGYDSLQSNGDGMGQRADVIYDMLNALQEEETVATSQIPDWEKRLSRWLKAKDILPYSVYHRHRKQEANEARKDERTLADIDLEADKPFDVMIFDMEFSDPQATYLLEARDLREEDEEEKEKEEKAGEERSGIERFIVRRRAHPSKVGVSSTPVFAFPESGQYASFTVRQRPGRHYAVFAFDYAVTYGPDGYCLLTAYHRRLGEETFRPRRTGGVPALHFEPVRYTSKAAPKASTGAGEAAQDAAKTTKRKARPNAPHQFVFLRPHCSSASKDFFIAVLSWKDEDEEKESQQDDDARPASEQTAMAALEAAFDLPRRTAAARETADKIVNFTQCRLGADDAGACAGPVSATYREDGAAGKDPGGKASSGKKADDDLAADVRNEGRSEGRAP